MSIGPATCARRNPDPMDWAVSVWVHDPAWGARRKVIRVAARNPEWAAKCAAAGCGLMHPEALALEIERVETAGEFLERIEREAARERDAMAAAGGWWRRLWRWCVKKAF